MKINIVNLTGYIPEPPIITFNKKGEFKSVAFSIRTMRYTSADEERRLLGRLQIDTIPIYTTSKYIYNKYIQSNGDPLIGQFSTVSLSGTLVTENTEKRIRCPKCGEIHVKPLAVIVFVEPESLIAIGKVRDEAEGRRYIQSIAFQSNQVLISGRVCTRKDNVYDADNHIPVFEFQIATTRLRHAKGKGNVPVSFEHLEDETDFPHVKSYGEKSYEYEKALQINSEVIITGAIETREVNPLYTCEHCGAAFKAIKPEPATEIVPYAIDYGRNCIFPTKEDESAKESLM